ncbi:MAG: EexN family lipoprotein [Arcobacteraceae bacterium]|jgi:PBP1b-binding outer membrane lipoprotein LpoB|nr:EexN family lipoprotein [Arcobacteraceae bacterium]
MKSILILIVAMFFIVGCQTQEAKTKEYYAKNLDKAKARVAECKKLETYNEIQQIDCQNATMALFSNTANRKNPYAENQNYDMRQFLGSNVNKKLKEESTSEQNK